MFGKATESKQSGDIHTKSKPLSVLRSAEKSIIKECEVFGATRTLQTGRISKEGVDQRGYQEIYDNIKHLQVFMAQSGLCVTTMSKVLHKYGLYGRVAKKSHSSRKAALSLFAKTHL